MLTVKYADGRTEHFRRGEPVTLGDEVVELHGFYSVEKQLLKRASECRQLRVLRLTHCEGADRADYHFPELTHLRMTGCKKLRSLEGLDAPKLVELRLGTGTPVTKTRIPERYHPIVLPRSTIARQSKPRAKPAQRKGDDAKRIRHIREMLRDQDPDRVDQGVELAAALGDDEVFRGLLEKTSIEQKPMKSCCPGILGHNASQLGIRGLTAWRLHHNGLFNTSANRRGIRDYAVLRLLEVWGDRGLVDLSEVDSWVVCVGGTPRVDLEPIVRLMPKLHTLVFWSGQTQLDNQDALAELPLLRRVVTWDVPVKLPPQVDTLHARVAPTGVQDIRTLVLASPPSAGQIARLVGVEDLRFQASHWSDGAVLKALVALPRLKRLHMRCWGNFRHVGALGQSQSLRELVLKGKLENPKVELAKLTASSIERLTVHSRYRTSVPRDRRHLLV